MEYILDGNSSSSNHTMAQFVAKKVAYLASKPKLTDAAFLVVVP